MAASLSRTAASQNRRTEVVDLTTGDIPATTIQPRAHVRGVRPSYTYNHEPEGEELIHQLGTLKGADLIGPLPARSHAFKTIPMDGPTVKNIDPKKIEPYGMTVHWTHTFQPRPEPT